MNKIATFSKALNAVTSQLSMAIKCKINKTEPMNESAVTNDEKRRQYTYLMHPVWA